MTACILCFAYMSELHEVQVGHVNPIFRLSADIIQFGGEFTVPPADDDVIFKIEKQQTFLHARLSKNLKLSIINYRAP